ncbi:MAG: GDCCVxC domain-containing (seleno)protein [Bacteroidota bacterium]
MLILFSCSDGLHKKAGLEDQTSATSEITCPQCGYRTREKMPEDVCIIKYTCRKCSKEMTPKKGDCCVYCTYGSHKCPSKQ